MSNDDELARVVKIPKFKGEVDQFPEFVMKFMAYAHLHRFVDALRKDPDPNMPRDSTVYLDKKTHAAQFKAVHMNNMAVTVLTTALEGKAMVAILLASRTSEWPQGLAYKIWKRLHQLYAPRDKTAEVEYMSALMRVEMKEGDDPSDLFGQLQAIKSRFGTIATDSALMAKAIEVATPMYKTVIATDMKTTGYDYFDLQATMDDFYRLCGGKQGSKTKGELALVEAEIAGNCWNCGEQGHKKVNCPKLAQGGNRTNKHKKGKFKGKCNKCGKVGHKEQDCWLDEKNASKRPSGWKRPGGEHAAAAVDSDGQGIELLLCQMSFPTEVGLLKDPNVWIYDTAATNDFTPHKQGLTNLRQAAADDGVVVGNGASANTEMYGDLPAIWCDKHGNEQQDLLMQGVGWTPRTAFNLFSASKRWKQGWSSGSDKKGFWVEKNGMRINFDIIIPTKSGAIFCAYLKRKSDKELGACAAEKPMKKVEVSIQQAHGRLGHCSEEMARTTAKHLDWTIKRGALKPCEACAVGKARQKNVTKMSEEPTAETVGGRIFLDLATIKQRKGMPKPQFPAWEMIVDDRTGMKITKFHRSKDAMVEPTCALLYQWKSQGIDVKRVRLDNAGENKTLQERSKSADWKLNLEFEFTARDSPQFNAKVEVGLSTIANRSRAVMAGANFPLEIRYRVYSEVFKTVTLLDGLTVITIGDETKTRVEHWCGKLPNFVPYLKQVGEAGTVKLKDKATPRVGDRGLTCIYMGPALDHSGDTYRMWSPKTGRVHQTRDVTWLNRMYYEKKVPTTDDIVVSIDIEPGEGGELLGAPIVATVEEEAEEEPAATVGEGQAATATAEAVKTTRSGRSVKAPSRLIEEIGDEQAPTRKEQLKQWRAAVPGADKADDEDSKEEETPSVALEEEEEEVGLLAATSSKYEIGLTAAEKVYYARMDALNELARQQDTTEFGLVGAGIGGGFLDTHELHVMKYDEAMATEDKPYWEEEVSNENTRMKEHDVFEVVPRSEVPTWAKVITSTWAMKKKANGTRRGRVNARGFEMVDGEHYDEDAKAAPVVQKITICIVMVLMLMAGWMSRVVDVRGAFLHGTFEKDRKVYMEVPQGFEKFYPGNVVLLLKKTLYGTKQAARAFWLKLLAVLKLMHYQRNKADPCLYYCWTEWGLCLMISWVDDIFIAGPKEAVDMVATDIQKHFEIDDQGELHEYVGCKIDWDKEQGRIKWTQPVLLQSFKDEFDLPTTGREPMTPATPGEVLQKTEEGSELDEQPHSIYRQGVGKLLHMGRWSRPEIGNAVRELTRMASKPAMAHLKAMYRLMQYCVNTENRGRVLKPTRSWDGQKEFKFRIRGRSDSDYAKDPETRRSVTGYAVFLEDAQIAEASRMQKSVTLSVTEAEYVAGTDCAQEMLFGMRILESTGLQVELPMLLEIDNKGAIDLTSNYTTAGGRTRHIDVRHHFLRELQEAGIIQVKWIDTNENSSDKYTKNLDRKTFEKHAQVPCGVDEYMKMD